MEIIMTALITLNNISKTFLTEEIETRALNNINLVINKGEYISLSGQSGCGKSTLLSLLGLLDAPSSGSYHLAGNDVSALTRDQRAKIRSEQIGFVFQSFNLISDLTVFENVMLPLTYQKGKSKKFIEDKWSSKYVNNDINVLSQRNGAKKNTKKDKKNDKKKEKREEREKI